VSKDGGIPWRFSWDATFFRQKTIGSIVVMGRNTFFSLPYGPLKNRINCIVSQTLNPSREAGVFRSLEEVAKEYSDFWIIGGAQLYNYALANDMVDQALITCVNQNYEADRFLNLSPLMDTQNFSRKITMKGEGYSVAEYVKNPQSTA
jgi:dihydrofolate reductase